MTLSIISFTKAGMMLSKRVADKLGEPGRELEEEPGKESGEEPGKEPKGRPWRESGVESGEEAEKTPAVRLFTKCGGCSEDAEKLHIRMVETSVAEWAGQQMREQSALLFIGACGIAVRAVAPHLADKLRDVPVLVMDERGNYVIPILSGHMGGGNELAGVLARRIGARAVITTATDINGKFAVDLFARENGFGIEGREGIAKVSAKVLAGEEITASIETGHEGGLLEREGVRIMPYPPEGYVDIIVTSEKKKFDAAILLSPKMYVLGVGCKKGKSAEEIRAFLGERLAENNILTAQVFALASIEQKREEEGILAWCRRERVPFLIYTARELCGMEGEFTTSAFVREQVGVDNVCERAALSACEEGGRLVMRKRAENGMTLAIAERDWKA